MLFSNLKTWNVALKFLCGSLNAIAEIKQGSTTFKGIVGKTYIKTDLQKKITMIKEKKNRLNDWSNICVCTYVRVEMYSKYEITFI